MTAWLQGNLWKAATGAAGVVVLALAFLLATSYMENRSLANQRNKLSQQINDPKTGYIAKLAQAQSNVVILTMALDEQNKKIEKLGAEHRARVAEAERRLKEAQRQTIIMERKLAGFLATGPNGSTLEERIRDIDERALKEFVE